MFWSMVQAAAWIIAVCFAFSGTPAAAQEALPPSAAAPEGGQMQPEADRLAAARDLLQATNTDAQFATIIPMMLTQLKQSMSPPNPKIQRELDQVFEEVQKQFIARRDEVLDQIAVLYARTFTAEEMKALADFYRSPAGKKFIAALPDLTTEAMRMGSAWGQQIAQDAERKVRDEMRRRGFDL